MKKLITPTRRLFLLHLFIINFIYAQNQPASDPSGNWVVMNDFSDEFSSSSSSLDATKWTTNVSSWDWYWDNANNITVNGGKAKVTMRYDPNTIIDNFPNSWNVELAPNGSGYIGIGGTQPTSIAATSLYKRTGTGGLRIGMYQEEYWHHNIISQTPTVANGTYNLSFYAWSSGGQTTAKVTASEFGGTTQTVTLPQNSGFTQYTISNIAVTNGKIKVAIEVESNPGTFVRLDDFSLTATGSSTNLLLNPGFEDRDTSNYKSGAFRSIKKIKYGYFEAKIKTSITPGTTSAFWLSANGIQDGNRYWRELDILEAGQSTSDPGRVEAARHSIFPTPIKSGLLAGKTLSNISTTFHTYGMEWDETIIKIYYDGVLAGSYTHNSEFSHPMNVIFSNGTRAPYSNNPTATGFPSTAEIEYIRAWKRPPSTAPVGKIIALHGIEGATNSWLTVDRSDLTSNNIPTLKETTTSSTPTSSQKFEVYDAGSGKIGLHPVDGVSREYVGIERNLTPVSGVRNSAAWVPTPNPGASNSWNTFEWKDLGQGVIALKVINGTAKEYFGIDRGGTTNSSLTNAASWEPSGSGPGSYHKFTWLDLGPISSSKNGNTKQVLSDQVNTTNEVLPFKFKVYPNPAKSIIHLNYYSKTEQIANFKLYDIGGKLVLDQDEKMTKGANNIDFTINGLSKGLYILKGILNSEKITEKIIIE